MSKPKSKTTMQKMKKRSVNFTAGVDDLSIPGLGNLKGGKIGFTTKNAPLASNTLTSGPSMKMVAAGASAVVSNSREFLSEYKFTGSEQFGDTLATVYLNPSVIPVPRLNQFAALFQKYVIMRLVLTLRALNAATATGGYVAYISYDPQEALAPPGTAAIRGALAHKSKIENNTWVSSTLEYIPTGNMLFVQPDPDDARLSDPGFFQLINLATPPADATILIELDYTIRFFDAVVNPLVGPTANASFSRLYASDFATATYNQPYGTSALVVASDYLGVQYVPATGTFRWMAPYPGTSYLILPDFKAVNTTDVGTYTTSFTNLTVNYSTIGNSPLLGTIVGAWFVTATSAGQCEFRIGFAAASDYASPSRAQFFITPYNTTTLNGMRPPSTRDRVAELEATVRKLLNPPKTTMKVTPFPRLAAVLDC